MDWITRLLDLFLAVKGGGDHGEKSGFKPIRWGIAAGGTAWAAYTFTLDQLAAKIITFADQAEQYVFALQNSRALDSFVNSVFGRLIRLFF